MHSVSSFSSNLKELKEVIECQWGKALEETSKASGRRIKDCSDKGVSEEVSFAGQCRFSGRLEGRAARIVGTDDYLEKLNGDVMSGTACGVMTFQDGEYEVVPFKAIGLGRLERHSPLGIEQLVSLIYFVDPPESLSWMRATIVLWEAVTDPKSQTIKATAYEWAGGHES
jgi:hypothetical protein